MTAAEPAIPYYCTKCAKTACSCWHVRKQTYKDAASTTWTAALLSAISAPKDAFDVWHLSCDAKREQPPVHAHPGATVECPKCHKSVVVHPVPCPHVKAAPPKAPPTVDTKDTKAVVFSDTPLVPFVCFKDPSAPCAKHWKVRGSTTHADRYEITCLSCNEKPAIFELKSNRAYKCPTCFWCVSVGISTWPIGFVTVPGRKKEQCKRCSGTGVFVMQSFVDCVPCKGRGGLPCRCVDCTHADPDTCGCNVCTCVWGLRSVCVMCKGDGLILKHSDEVFKCPFCECS
jgi:hypothetical protein